jgi:tellurite resistance protein
MENEARIDLLARVARATSSAGGTSLESGSGVTILSLAAASYGAQPSEDATVPTGFDPVAVALFEAIVEGAFLVANADGTFDEEERRTFGRVVVAACAGTVAPQPIAALISDLADQLQEDGMDRRIEALSKALTKKEHAREALRIAALLAQSSGDVSSTERSVLSTIAARCGLEGTEVDAALADVKAALSAVKA